MDLIHDIKRLWNDRKALARIMIEIVETQMRLAEDIAGSLTSEEQAFIDEAGFGNISKARAKAKTLTGNQTIKYKYQFDALSNLLSIVVHRVTFLQTQAHQEDNPQPNAPSLDLPTTSADLFSQEEELRSTSEDIPEKAT